MSCAIAWSIPLLGVVASRPHAVRRRPSTGKIRSVRVTYVTGETVVTVETGPLFPEKMRVYCTLVMGVFASMLGKGFGTAVSLPGKTVRAGRATTPGAPLRSARRVPMSFPRESSSTAWIDSSVRVSGAETSKSKLSRTQQRLRSIAGCAGDTPTFTDWAASGYDKKSEHHANMLRLNFIGILRRYCPPRGQIRCPLAGKWLTRPMACSLQFGTEFT